MGGVATCYWSGNVCPRSPLREILWQLPLREGILEERSKRESSGRYEMGGATGREQAVSGGSSAPTAFDARGALPACYLTTVFQLGGVRRSSSNFWAHCLLLLLCLVVLRGRKPDQSSWSGRRGWTWRTGNGESFLDPVDLTTRRFVSNSVTVDRFVHSVHLYIQNSHTLMHELQLSVTCFMGTMSSLEPKGTKTEVSKQQSWLKVVRYERNFG